MLNVLIEMASADYRQGFNRRAASSSPFFVASGVSRIIILRRAFDKLRTIREFEPTHVGCYVMVASGVSRIILFCRAFDKLRTIREFEPTHVGCYVMIDELAAL